MNSGNIKTALITGVRGQDGPYLAELLLSKGYHVYGTSHTRPGAPHSPAVPIQVQVLYLDICKASEVLDIIEATRPDEVYNLAARSSSAQLFDGASATAEVNGLAAVHFLEAIRQVSPHTRFLQASSSEIFAGGNTSPQDEGAPFRPVNAYGAAKAYAANIVAVYRAHYGLFATTAILFNHESPRREINYVTRKITHTIAQIALGQAGLLTLGALDSRRDWGFAGDYVRAMWLMLQQPAPKDFVIATGETHSVREFCEIAFSHVGLDYRDFVRLDPLWVQRSESTELCGNAEKAQRLLGWQPRVSFVDLVRMMIDSDLAQLQAGIGQP